MSRRELEQGRDEPPVKRSSIWSAVAHALGIPGVAAALHELQLDAKRSSGAMGYWCEMLAVCRQARFRPEPSLLCFTTSHARHGLVELITDGKPAPRPCPELTCLLARERQRSVRPGELYMAQEAQGGCNREEDLVVGGAARED